MPPAALTAFRTHRGNARRRRIGFEFSLEQWWAW